MNPRFGGTLRNILIIARNLTYAALEYLRHALNPLDRRKEVDVKRPVVFLPGMHWNFPLRQRPHHLASEFVKRGHDVFYCTTSSIDVAKGVDVCGVKLVKMYRGIAALKNPIIVAYTPYAWGANVLFGPGATLIFDFLDDFTLNNDCSKFGKWLHENWLKKSDLVIATSKILYEQAKLFSKKVVICPNAADTEFFLNAKSEACPEFKTTKSVPIVGYVGAISDWFDFELLEFCALNRSQYSFILVGRCLTHQASKRLEKMPKNVTFIGERAYHSLPSYYREFKCGLIPFILNKVTLATSPVKLYEYFSCNVPVVSTDLPDCYGYDSCFIANDKEDFLRKIDHCVNLEADLRDKIVNIAQENKWSNRLDTILDSIGAK